MQRAIKILVVLFILSAYPAIRFVAQHFVIEVDTEIYNFVPQEADVIIEVNSRNFFTEAAYQRIFNEDYYNEKIAPDPEIEPPDILAFGVDFFSSIILFRENWAEENIWMGIMGYTDQNDFQKFMADEVPNSIIRFCEHYAIVQLTPSKNQEKLDEHLDNIVNQKVKPITAKLNIESVFNREREINCYFAPEGTSVNNQIIDGFLSFDFKKDDIKIDGEFTPVSGLDKGQGIAYALDEEAAFSMRSSLNIFNSIYWFGKEKITNIPEYSQMAMDYDGVKILAVDPNLGYDFPYKFFPEYQIHFDILQPKVWHDFFDSLRTQGKMKVDTVTNQIITPQGVYFNYNLTNTEFEIMRSTISLQKIENDRTCFVMHMNIDPLIENTKIAVDEQNPPNRIMQNVLVGGLESMMSELQVMANIDKINFRMVYESETKIEAEGEVMMKEKDGNAIIEGMFFTKGALLFLKDYLTAPEM